MKKIILMCLISIIMCFTLVGCDTNLDENENINNESINTNENENIQVETNAETDGISAEKFESICDRMDYILDNTFIMIEQDSIKEYIKHKTEYNNLLDDESFKFAFAFQAGVKLFFGKYLTDDHGLATGELAIKLEDFEYIYSKLYGEKYEFKSVPVGTKYTYDSSNGNICGKEVTGYDEVYLTQCERDNNSFFIALRLTENNELFGNVQIMFSNTENNNIKLTELYINEGAEAQ